ncbi:MAG: hypothetical protein HY039_07590 [Nitrospirae bacterium]|nr:hypothetical protein [Nitrospirota bacterium]
MPRVTFHVPSEVKAVVSKHGEIDWDRFVTDTLWTYAKKLRLLDCLASRSKLTHKDVEALDRAIKADLLKKYQNA